MEDQIKQIVATFTGLPVDMLHLHTRIDRTSVANSIVLHRMYAQLAIAGYTIDDYSDIHTFGDLLKKVTPAASAPASLLNNLVQTAGIQSGVGIDLELIAQMPKVNDFRQESFYTLNFSASEIAYCILQPDPYASFTGLFAAKEAIVKADNRFRGFPFYQISITHTPNGTPVFSGFQLSISHARDYAIAIAISSPHQSDLSLPASKNSSRIQVILLTMIFIGLFIAFIAVLKSC